MCSASTAMKNLNTQMQSLSTSMASEAKSVFTTANSAVQKVIGSVSNIVDAGASQLGFSAGQKNAMDAASVQGGATMARNLKGAAASGAAAVGGGNVSLPSGAAGAPVLQAEQAASAATAASENENLQADYKQGNENYWKAIDTTEKAPETLDVANKFNTNAIDANTAAQKSQQNIDTQGNWWKDDIMKVGMDAAGMATAGLSNMAADSNNSFLSGAGDFGKNLTGTGS